MFPAPLFSRRPARSILLLAAWLLTTVATGRGAQTLPPLEPWGDLKHPYGDSLEAAARHALGTLAREGGLQDPGISLEDFFALQVRIREGREGAAKAACARAFTLKKMSGIDSLELYLGALLTAPNSNSAYEQVLRILFDCGDTDRAKALAVQAIRLDPQDEILWVYLGEVYRRGGDVRKARAALEYAVGLGGGPSRRTNAVQALAMLYLRAGEAARADSLLRADPEATPPWLAEFTRAVQARRTGDLQTARENLLQATNHPDAPAAAFVELATVEKDLGHLDAAERAYTHALELAPHENAAHTGLGLIEMARGDLEGAAGRFAARVRQSPADSTAQFNLGRALLQIAAASPARAESIYAQAEAAFTACIEANYNEASTRLGRAQARWGRGNLDGAAEDARSLVDSPAHADRARFLLARVALTQGRPQEVADHLRPLADRNELDANGWAMLGKAYLELGRAEPAVEALEKARTRAPGEQHVVMNYAVALSQVGRLEEAEKLLRDLARPPPGVPAVLQHLAAVLDKRGRDTEADALMEQIETQPR